MIAERGYARDSMGDGGEILRFAAAFWLDNRHVGRNDGPRDRINVEPFEFEADMSVRKAEHIGLLLLGLRTQIFVQRPFGILNGLWIQTHGFDRRKI